MHSFELRLLPGILFLNHGTANAIDAPSKLLSICKKGRDG